jgi:hypothetical protein
MTDIPQEVLDEHRDCNVHDEWWDSTIEGFIEDMEEKGISTDAEHVFFSGFWCQGDGASYAGSINVPKFFAAHPEILEPFPHHAHMIRVGGDDFSIQIKQDGRYNHEFTMSLVLLYDVNLYDYFDTDTALGQWAYEQLDKGVDDELSDFEDAVLEVVRGFAKQLYRDLEQEYEYLTSDEAVKEAIEANGWWTPEQEAA